MSTGKDHPRLRGEKFGEVKNTARLVGSPPLTRGKAVALQVLPVPPGITPAYAGKRFFSGRRSGILKDHPRLRGEKFVVRSGLFPQQGSPPLTRGKVDTHKRVCYNLRITPAYAGKRQKVSYQ